MSLDEGLEEQSYDIKDELKIRKKLEQHTEWCIEFTKNNRYAPDMQLYRWPDRPTVPTDRELFGYVELERARKDKSESWITGDPPESWSYASFLKRKTHEWDFERERWDGYKDDYRHTLYLKFNHTLDNCFVAPVAVVARDGFKTGRSDGSRQNTYLALWFDHPDLVFGIDNAIDKINSWLSGIDTHQTGLEEYQTRPAQQNNSSDECWDCGAVVQAGRNVCRSCGADQQEGRP